MPERTDRAAAPWIAGAAAALFAVLALLVLLGWGPLDDADQRVAVAATGFSGTHGWALSAANAVTVLGATSTLAVVAVAAAVGLAVARRFRAAVVVLIAYGLEVAINPLVKNAVGRERPVVGHPVAVAAGHSFPSGHSFGSLACYGAIALATAAACGIGARGRRTLIALSVLLAGLVGLSRVMLGVHFASDVVAGWCLGASVLAGATVALSTSRHGPRNTDSVPTLPA